MSFPAFRPYALTICYHTPYLPTGSNLRTPTHHTTDLTTTLQYVGYFFCFKSRPYKKDHYSINATRFWALPNYSVIRIQEIKRPNLAYS